MPLQGLPCAARHTAVLENAAVECKMPEGGTLNRAVLALQQWAESLVLHQLSGPVADTVAPIQKRALDTVSSRFANLPSPSRATIAPLISAIERQILSARGAGAERSLEAWTRTSTTMPITEWLATFPRVRPAATQSANARFAPENSTSCDAESDSHDWRLIALLMLDYEPNLRPSTH